MSTREAWAALWGDGEIRGRGGRLWEDPALSEPAASCPGEGCVLSAVWVLAPPLQGGAVSPELRREMGSQRQRAEPESTPDSDPGAWPLYLPLGACCFFTLPGLRASWRRQVCGAGLSGCWVWGERQEIPVEGQGHEGP